MANPRDSHGGPARPERVPAGVQRDREQSHGNQDGQQQRAKPACPSSRAAKLDELLVTARIAAAAADS
jgi:hypothetical protein